MELRCSNKLHAVVFDSQQGSLEVACHSRWCGKLPGIVVIHRFDLSDGSLVSTKRFKKPPKPPTHEGGNSGTH